MWASIIGWKHRKNTRKKSIQDLVVYGKRKTNGQCYVYIVFSFWRWWRCNLNICIYLLWICLFWMKTNKSSTKRVSLFFYCWHRSTTKLSLDNKIILNQYTFHYEFKTFGFYDMACHFGGSKLKSITLFDKCVCLTVISIQHPAYKCST